MQRTIPRRIRTAHFALLCGALFIAASWVSAGEPGTGTKGMATRAEPVAQPAADNDARGEADGEAAPASEPVDAKADVDAQAAADHLSDVPPEFRLDEPDPLLGPEDGPMGGYTEMIAQLLKMLLMLGIVLAIVYLVLNKGVGRLLARTQQGKRVQVVERIPLEQRRALYLIKYDGRELLLASSEGGMSVIGGEQPPERAQPSNPVRYARDFDGALSAHRSATAEHAPNAPASDDDEDSVNPLEVTKKG